MGYLFLALALSAGLMKAYCGKRSSSAVTRTSDAITITTVRMLMCCGIGLVLPFLAGESLVPSSPKILLIALACGVFSACFVVLWLLSVRNTMYMMVEVFVAGGVILPLVLCNVIYGEPIGPLDAIGVFLLLVGIYCMSRGEKTKKEKWSFGGFLLLILVALSSGATDFTQKIYINEFPGESSLVFNFYVYVFATAVLLIANLFLKIKNNEPRATSLAVIKPIWGYVAIMAVGLFLNSYFKTRAAGYLDAVVLYPVNQGLAILLSTVMATLLFREKLNARALLGIALTLVAIILININ